jgi:SAM-dependent methyltransferase
MPTKDHWESVYSTKTAESVSWFQENAEQSLRLIRESGLPRDASIIDVGGGASRLVDGLLDAGYTRLSVLDISATAMAAARRRLGERAARVHWLETDILGAALPEQAYDLWHDRAVFHFLTDPADRQAYVDTVLRAVRPGGLVVVATFAEDGPERCSGLPVRRYRPDELHAEFGAPFLLLGHEKEAHRTPSGAVQQFVYCYCRRQ